MTPNDRWKRVQELFELLDPLPDHLRHQELERAEADPDLRIEVLSLLQAIRDEELAQDTFRHQTFPQTTLAADWSLADPDLQFISLIGSGGAGTVFKALRKVNGVEQQVAVKIYHAHRSAAVDQERFLREQRMLAALSDPGIVRFLDSGTTADGRPYLVMELAEGEHITRHCDLQRLDIDARLRLLLSVCRAVASAHARLIVHLDLKPSNILVTADGDIKLLDFGTARLIDHSHAFVVTEQLTPHYASPERLRGEPASVSSDVYSLGLILYELCSGASPFPQKLSIVGMAERANRRTTATAPAQAVSAESAALRSTSLEKLRRLLKGDLASICAKALAFDSAERYLTVTELADDLRRFLAGEPVAAHAPTSAYLTSKFIKRYWGRLLLVAAVTMGLSAAAVYSWLQARNARIAAERAEAAQIFLSNILAFSSTAAGSKSTVPQLLELARGSVSGLSSKDPALASDIELALGMARPPEDPLGADSVNRALNLAKTSGDVTRQASALTVLGYRSYLANRPEEAWERFRQALQLWSLNRSQFSPARAAWVLSTAGAFMVNVRPFDKSVREPLAVCLQLTASSSTVPQYLRLACLQAKALSLLFGSNEYEAALPLLLEAVDLRRKKPISPGALAESLQLLGLNYRFLGRYREDEAVLRESYQIVVEFQGPESLQAANSRAVWSTSLAGTGNFSEGLPQAEAALAVYRRVYPQRGALLLYTPLSAAMTNACLLGRYAVCESYAREALQCLGSNPSPNDTRVASVQGYLGLALAHLGRQRGDVKLMAEAKTLLEIGLKSLREQKRKFSLHRKPMEDASAALQTPEPATALRR